MKNFLKSILFVLFHIIFISDIGQILLYLGILTFLNLSERMPVLNSIIKTLHIGGLFLFFMFFMPYLIKFSALPVFYLTSGDNKFISGIFDNLLNPQKRLLTLFYILFADIVTNSQILFLCTESFPKDETDIVGSIFMVLLLLFGGGVFLCYIVFLIWHRFFVKNKQKDSGKN